MYDEFVFGKDLFLKTDYPIAYNSNDFIDPGDISGAVHNYTNGTAFATELLARFPGKRTLIDLGCATGTVPLSMRQETTMLAVGLEGSDKPKKRGLGCWSVAPEIVMTCDIGKPFYIVDNVEHPVVFDFVTSWGVFEHLPDETGLRCALENVSRLLSDEGIGILNIDLGGSEGNLHMLWAGIAEGGYSREDGLPEGCDAPDRYAFLNRIVPEYFLIDDVFKHQMWNYCRPDEIEKKDLRAQGKSIYAKRSFWWVSKKKTK